jgi:hypothetical protein
MITQSELKQLLDYDPNTGVFTWKVRKTNKIQIGDKAGNLSCKGYIVIAINQKSYKAHRLAWLYIVGDWPTDMIDHVNGCKSDNSWENLRDVSHRGNCCNRDKHRNGKLPGTSWYQHHKKWRAQIRINGKIEHLGYFDTEEEASHAYLKAKANLDA